MGDGTDWRGVWTGRLVRRRQRAATFVDGVCARSAAALWDVHIGEGCVFHGRPIFNRIPHSVIWVGDSCVFRSAPWSNRIGVNRPCMLSTLTEDARISIGDLCGFSGTVVAAASEISMGDRVLCGANVTITDTDWHGMRPPRACYEPAATAPVRICDDVWLGLGVVVLKGVTIGKGTIVAAGSIVTKSIPEGVVAAGSPCEVIGEIQE